MPKRNRPKPRKLATLWQAYMWWWGLKEIYGRSLRRINAVERGASSIDAEFERQMIELTGLEKNLEIARNTMIEIGERTAGPIWDWGTEIKGLGAGGLFAQVLALIDDIGNFDTISKLWAHSGWRPAHTPREDGGRSYDGRLKGATWNVADSFIKQGTEPYRSEYDNYKSRLRQKYPHGICQKCGGKAEKVGKNWKCVECGAGAKGFNIKYTDSHIDKMARRRTAKLFLSRLWVAWREAGGLPVSKPYVEEYLGHEHVVQ